MAEFPQSSAPPARGQVPLSSLPHCLVLSYFPGGKPEASRAMEEWTEGVRRESRGRVGVSRRDPAGQLFLPSVGLWTGTGSKIFYHFVPRGAEETAFRDLLWQVSSGEQGPPEGSSTETGAGSDPLELKLFVSNECPNCPKAVRFLTSLPQQLPRLAVHLFNATQDIDLAEKNGIKSVPVLLIGNALRYVGDLPRERLASLLRSQDPGALLQEQVRQSIQDGRALEAADMIVAKTGAVFLAADLLRSSFQERIGLLLTLEEVLEREPGCLDPLVQDLLPGLESGDTSLRGDLADLLGRIGHPDALPALRKLSRDQNPDVAEAAAEAVESILNRKRPRTGGHRG